MKHNIVSRVLIVWYYLRNAITRVKHFMEHLNETPIKVVITIDTLIFTIIYFLLTSSLLIVEGFFLFHSP